MAEAKERQGGARARLLGTPAKQSCFLLGVAEKIRELHRGGRGFATELRMAELLLADGVDPNTPDCAPEAPLLYSLCRRGGFPPELEDLIADAPGLRLDLPAAGGALRAEALALEAGNPRLAARLQQRREPARGVPAAAT